MKQKFFSLLLCLFFIQNFVFSQREDTLTAPSFKSFKIKEEAERPNIVKINPLRLLLGRIPYGSELSISYERMLAPRHALVLTGNFNFPGLAWLIPSDSFNLRQNFSWFLGGGGRIHYRYYPLKKHKGPKGLFFGPVFSYNYGKLKVKNSNDFARWDNLDAGVIVGNQFLFKKKIVLELFGGLGWKRDRIRYWDDFLKRYEEVNTNITGQFRQLNFLRNVQIYFGLNLGYAF